MFIDMEPQACRSRPPPPPEVTLRNFFCTTTNPASKITKKENGHVRVPAYQISPYIPYLRTPPPLPNKSANDRDGKKEENQVSLRAQQCNNLLSFSFSLTLSVSPSRPWQNCADRQRDAVLPAELCKTPPPLFSKKEEVSPASPHQPTLPSHSLWRRRRRWRIGGLEDCDGEMILSY